MTPRKTSIWWDEQAVLSAWDGAKSQKQILQRLGQKMGSGNYANLRAFAERYGLEIPIFHSDLSYLREYRKISDDEYYSKGIKRGGSNLRIRLLRDGHLQDKCYACGLGNVWNDLPIVMTVEHIDGDNLNNALDNLTFLCHNCHSQTVTFSGRNVKNRLAKSIYFCGDGCGKRVTSSGNFCGACRGAKRRKINWPDLDELDSLVVEYGYSGAGKKLGVSDSSVRKALNRLKKEHTAVA